MNGYSSIKFFNFYVASSKFTVMGPESIWAPGKYQLADCLKKENRVAAVVNGDAIVFSRLPAGEINESLLLPSQRVPCSQMVMCIYFIILKNCIYLLSPVLAINTDCTRANPRDIACMHFHVRNA